jgi:hypothetical protein
MPVFGKKPAQHEIGFPLVRLIYGDRQKETAPSPAKTTEPKWGVELDLGKAGWTEEAADESKRQLIVELWSRNGQERLLGHVPVTMPVKGTLQVTRALLPDASRKAPKSCGQIALEIVSPFEGPVVEDTDVFGWEPF